MVPNVRSPLGFILGVSLLCLFAVACAPDTLDATPTPTFTVTPAMPASTSTPSAAGGSGSAGDATATLAPTATPEPSPTASPTPSPCEGVSGSLEVRALVGPAAAVGLTTHAVGTIPFTVGTAQSPYAVSGGDHISFSDVLSEDDIHYDVSFEADVAFDGTCDLGPGGAQLLLGLEMVWDQIVNVTAEDFDETYANSGEESENLILPLIDGTSASLGGEGLEVVLHLN
ncbi:MAG: hypothetical protein MUF84_15760 [Anaerolineae bacterium]|jgi:hypothetical protein|nr:hypothetical protein [Anaerolineae bacterium]